MSASDDLAIQYCSICDKYFLDKDLLQMHIQTTDAHPKCDTCNRRFLNKNSLRNHLLISSKHHYCQFCELSFGTSSGLRVHRTIDRAHHNYTKYGPPEGFLEFDDVMEWTDGWEDRLGQLQDARRLKVEGEEMITWDGVGSRKDNASEPELKKEQPISNVRAKVLLFESMKEKTKAKQLVPSSHATLPAKSEVKAKKTKKAPKNSAAFTYRCPICMCKPKSTSTTRCGHMFCTPCITKAFGQHEQPKCPSCRKSSLPGQLRTVVVEC